MTWEPERLDLLACACCFFEQDAEAVLVGTYGARGVVACAGDVATRVRRCPGAGAAKVVLGTDVDCAREAAAVESMGASWYWHVVVWSEVSVGQALHVMCEACSWKCDQDLGEKAKVERDDRKQRELAHCFEDPKVRFTN